MTEEKQVENKSNEAQPSLEAIHFYIKEQSCKVPQGFMIFNEEWKPEVNVELDYKHEALGNDVYEVVIRLGITAKNNQRTAYTVELLQAGVFRIKNIPDEQKNLLLNIYCPNMIYPYARKAVADLTHSAGFQSLSLVPVNFEMVYQQRLAKEAKPELNPIH